MCIFCDVYFTFYTVSSRAALGVGHIEKAGKREKEEEGVSQEKKEETQEEDEKERRIGRESGTLLSLFAG